MTAETGSERERIMERWDAWRKYIAEGGEASWPRDDFEALIDSFEDKLRSAQETISWMSEELETERMRLSACGVAALQNTERTMKDRITPDNPYWSASYKDVCNAVDREIKFRIALEAIRDSSGGGPFRRIVHQTLESLPTPPSE